MNFYPLQITCLQNIISEGQSLKLKQTSIKKYIIPNTQNNRVELVSTKSTISINHSSFFNLIRDTITPL